MAIISWFNSEVFNAIRTVALYDFEQNLEDANRHGTRTGPSRYGIEKGIQDQGKVRNGKRQNRKPNKDDVFANGFTAATCMYFSESPVGHPGKLNHRFKSKNPEQTKKKQKEHC